MRHLPLTRLYGSWREILFPHSIITLWRWHTSPPSNIIDLSARRARRRAYDKVLIGIGLFEVCRRQRSGFRSFRPHQKKKYNDHIIYIYIYIYIHNIYIYIGGNPGRAEPAPHCCPIGALYTLYIYIYIYIFFIYFYIYIYIYIYGPHGELGH